MKSFRRWKTVTLGTGLKTGADFHAAFRNTACYIAENISDVLRKLTSKVSLHRSTVPLVNASVAGLGFKEATTRKHIYARANEMGLGICPDEVVLQLPLQHSMKRQKRWLHIATKPVTDAERNPLICGVAYDGGKVWLCDFDGSPEQLFDTDSRFVFVGSRA